MVAGAAIQQTKTEAATAAVQAVPKGYKRTELGVIPEDWEVVKLGDLFTLKGGVAFSSEFFSESGPILLTPGNFKLSGGLYFDEGNTKHFNGAYNASEVLRKNDLLIVMTDLTPDCNLLGKPAFVESDQIILHNQRIGKAKLKLSSLSERYLYHVLLTSAYLGRVKEMATGSTVRHTSNKSIYNISVLTPPLAEQQVIAEALSDVDGWLASLDALIAKKRDLKTAAMQQILAGHTRLPGFTDEWKTKKLGDIAYLLKGNGLSKSSLSSEGKKYCILYGELFTFYGRVITKPVSKTISSDGILSEYGDVLMPGSTTTSGIDLATASTVLMSDVAIGGDVNIIRNKTKEYDPVFLAYRLTYVERQRIAEIAQGITIHHLYGKDLRALSIKLPTIEEQAAIATILSDMDAEIAMLEAEREKASAIKQGMMQELLTGKTRLV